MTTVHLDGPFVFNTTPIAPNGGTFYFWIDGSDGAPPPPYKDCTLTVTAHGLSGLVSGPQFIEVVQTATRAGPGFSDHFLDIVVRNNGPRPCPYIKVFVSIVTP